MDILPERQDEIFEEVKTACQCGNIDQVLGLLTGKMGDDEKAAFLKGMMLNQISVGNKMIQFTAMASGLARSIAAETIAFEMAFEPEPVTEETAKVEAEG
jgi:hypothetical protein